MSRSFKRLLIAAGAITALMLGSASAAYAGPNKTSACANCHGSDPSVAVTVAQTANTGTTATYRVTVANPNGTAGWAVLSGSTNLARGTATTGTFTVPVGATYTVWGASVGGNEGASSVTINPVTPPVVVPPVVDPPVVVPPVVDPPVVVPPVVDPPVVVPPVVDPPVVVPPVVTPTEPTAPPVVTPTAPSEPATQTGKVKVKLSPNKGRKYTVTLTDTETQATLTAKGNKGGKAEFKKVPYGTYTLTVVAGGKTYTQTVNVAKKKVEVKIKLDKFKKVHKNEVKESANSDESKASKESRESKKSSSKRNDSKHND